MRLLNIKIRCEWQNCPKFFSPILVFCFGWKTYTPQTQTLYFEISTKIEHMSFNTPPSLSFHCIWHLLVTLPTYYCQRCIWCFFSKVSRFPTLLFVLCSTGWIFSFRSTLYLPACCLCGVFALTWAFIYRSSPLTSSNWTPTSKIPSLSLFSRFKSIFILLSSPFLPLISLFFILLNCDAGIHFLILRLKFISC